MLLLFLIAAVLLVAAWVWFGAEGVEPEPPARAEPPPPSAPPPAAPAAQEEIRDSDREALQRLLERERSQR